MKTGFTYAGSSLEAAVKSSEIAASEKLSCYSREEKSVSPPKTILRQSTVYTKAQKNDAAVRIQKAWRGKMARENNPLTMVRYQQLLNTLLAGI